MDMDVYRYLYLRHKRFHNKSSLTALRKFLDENGCKMPKPKYLHEEEDQTTWKWIDVLISDNGGYQMAIPNPDFKFKDVYAI